MAAARRPADVTAEFRVRVAELLVPLGFAARAKNATFVRKAKLGTHRVELGSSHENRPGRVACWISLSVLDPAIEAIEAGWRAGGMLSTEPFADEIDDNVAVRASADALLEHLRARLDFFALLDDAPGLLAAACRGYVPGALEPKILVPYLRARLGADAARTYAAALLAGRPELWPGFLGELRALAGPPGTPKPKAPGSEAISLAQMLAAHAPGPALEAPADAVVSEDRVAASLRGFLGLQLRAWGEPEAAARLCAIEDADVKAIRAANEKLGGPVWAPDRARHVLEAVTGEARAPKRTAPSPQAFQYRAQHRSFAMS